MQSVIGRTLLHFLFTIILLSITNTTFGRDSTDAGRPITIDDFFGIKNIGDPQVSPDDKWVAYTVAETDLENDKRETRIWMKSLAGGEAIPMTAKGYSASRPRWSPDGKYLSFNAAKNDGKSQVWTLNRMGGESQQLTNVEQGISGYEWSPDGSRILLSIKDDADVDKDENEKEKPEPWVINRLQFKRDNTGYLDTLRTHLYVYNVADSSLTQITSGPYDDSQAVWSPDGALIAFVSNRTPEPDASSNSDIWIVDPENTDKGETLIQVTTNPGSDSSPAWSPDGAWLTYTTVIQPDLIWYATRHLAVISVEGGEPHVLTESLDRRVSSPRFSPDGRHITFLLEDSAERHLARIDVDGRNLTRIIPGQRSVRTYMTHRNGRIATVISTPRIPGEIYLHDQAGLRKLTAVNESLFSDIRLGEVENVTFNSKDGTEIEGFIIKPPGFDPRFKYPTLLRIHGGPVAQYDFAFKYEAQLFAANGYVVVMTNPRGSAGYGQKFSMGIYQNWGEKDFEDVVAGVDYAIAQGYSDPERLGVGGWSYGGILTNYVITKTDRFKGAITGASEVLYRSNYGHDHYQLQWEKELGLPWRNSEAWERISPFNYVENIVTPTLIMGGEKDWNVPILNSEQLYQALRRLGRTTQLVVYPGEHHGIRKPTFQKDRYERYLEWYGKYVKAAVPASSAQ